MAGAVLRLDWGNAEHAFALRIGELNELQQSVNRWRARIGAPLIGPASLLQAIKGVDAWADEVREVIRLGLIGGGMSPVDALDLVRRYVDGRPIAESSRHAYAILAAALVGLPDEPIEGKAKTAETPTTGSASPSSTETGP